MNTLERLERGKKRLEKGWCQYALIKMEGMEIADKTVSYDDPRVIAHCGIGCLLDDFVDFGHREAVNLLRKTIHEMGIDVYPHDDLISWNNRDGRTKEQMIALFDKAIEECKSN